MVTGEVEVVADVDAWTGESPVWDPRRACLYWVDIPRGAVHRYAEAGGDQIVHRLPEPVGAVACSEGGGLVAAVGLGFMEIRDGQATQVATVATGDRMNDGKCDPAGRFLAGTMTEDRRPGSSALYQLGSDRRARQLLGGVTLSNGLGWSPDGSTLYYVDTPTRRVDAFAYDLETGDISHRRTFVDLEGVPGNPDGLTVDADGGVWVVMARGGTVRCFSPRGRQEMVVELPVQRVTSCTFGGADLGDLYVTTGTFGDRAVRSSAQPAGSLLRLRPGVVGLPAATFAD